MCEYFNIGPLLGLLEYLYTALDRDYVNERAESVAESLGWEDRQEFLIDAGWTMSSL